MTKDRTIGEKLREMRHVSGMTQVELARAADVTQNSIAQWETGVRTPNVRSAAALANALGANPTEFLARPTTKRKIAAHVAAARDPRWIRAKERLPKPFESVLLYTPDEAPLPTVHEGYIDNEGDWHRLTIFDASRVTHWMPMPSAPEEAKGDG